MRALILVLVLTLVCSGAALAQDCVIGVFSDPLGQSPPWYWPADGTVFSLYVVLFAEDTVAAAAYSMTYPQGPSGMFLQARFSGPSGSGLVIDEPTGTNVALGECVIGFGNSPVLIDEWMFVVFPGYSDGFVTLGPNTSQHPDFPQYVTCNDLKRDCIADDDFYVGIVSTESTSFGAIKALFGN